MQKFLFKLLLHFAEMTRKRVNAKRRSFEIVGFPPGKQLDHVLQVQQAVVDRRRGQEINVFAFTDVEESPVMR